MTDHDFKEPELAGWCRVCRKCGQVAEIATNPCPGKPEGTFLIHARGFETAKFVSINELPEGGV